MQLQFEKDLAKVREQQHSFTAKTSRVEEMYQNEVQELRAQMEELKDEHAEEIKRLGQEHEREVARYRDNRQQELMDQTRRHEMDKEKFLRNEEI